MKPLVKIIILCIIIIVVSLVIAKKSIDYTFKEVECSQTTQIKNSDFRLVNEQL